VSAAALPAAQNLAPAADSNTTTIVHVTVVDVASGKESPDQTVILEGERIASLATSDSSAPSQGRILDAHGAYLIPGLGDMHVHIQGLLQPRARLDQAASPSSLFRKLKRHRRSHPQFRLRQVPGPFRAIPPQQYLASPHAHRHRAMGYMNDSHFTSDPRVAYMSGDVRRRWDPANDFRFRRWRPQDFELHRQLFKSR
jgi:hypothetical protein